VERKYVAIRFNAKFSKTVNNGLLHRIKVPGVENEGGNKLILHRGILIMLSMNVY
jgi:hypothetical protein